MSNKPQESISLLIAGNERFNSGNPIHANTSPERLRSIKGKQEPYATIITCSDSRVPPEILFDSGIGELFVIRTAGNILDETAIASVLYGVVHLGTPVVLVLSHQSCGAVTASFSSDQDLAKEPSSIQTLVSMIRKNAQIEPDRVKNEPGELRRAIDANARSVVSQLNALPEITERVKAGCLSVLDGYFSFDDGTVLISPAISDL